MAVIVSPLMQANTLHRVCKHCGRKFTMTMSDRPRGGCCSRECHQAYKVANGLRKPPPPKKNDPAEAGVVYGLCDPVSHQVRYIGKTVDLKSRIRRYRSGRHHSPHLKNWIASLGRKGQWPEVKVLETCLFGLGDAEKHWIKHGRERGWDLINATDGGDSGRPNAIAIANNRKAQYERFQRPDEIRKHKLASQKNAAIKAGKTHQQWRNDRAAQLREKRYRMIHADAIREAERLQRIAQADQRKAAERDARQQAFGVIVPLTCKGVAFVPLTRGAWAVIDAEDWDRVSQFRWALQIKTNVNGMIYHRAKRSFGDGGVELLPRFITSAGNGEAVRHRNGMQLDCRKCNIYKDLGPPVGVCEPSASPAKGR